VLIPHIFRSSFARRLAVAGLMVCAFLLHAESAKADSGIRQGMEIVPTNNPRIDMDQTKLGGSVPLDAFFNDETGTVIPFSDALGGRPTILVMAYFRCPQLCNLVITDLISSLRKEQMAKLTCGKDYSVVVVSFDPKEASDHEKVLHRKRLFVNEYGRKEADAGVRFLTGTKASIDRLTADVGFHYEYDRMLKEYNHPSGLIFLTAEGVISQYLPGLDYQPRDVNFAIIQASGGKVGTASERFFLSCFRYNPHLGTYTADVMFLVKNAGLLIVVLILAIASRIAFGWRGFRTFAIGFVLLAGVAVAAGVYVSTGAVKYLVWREKVYPLDIQYLYPPVILGLAAVLYVVWIRHRKRTAGTAVATGMTQAEAGLVG
jgi:protein SCO1